MKRFYCTVCRKVKRVQNWPRQIENVDSVDVSSRVGVCNRHVGRSRWTRANDEQAEARLVRK